MGDERGVGPYELLRQLGAGGFGAVWAGRHRETGAVHALKLVELGDAEDALRFQREAEAATRLEAHPHALRVHGCFVAGGRGVLVTELVEGAGDLAARLAREGPLPLPEAVRIVREVAGALVHAHARGVLHRDLKPQNVLLDLEGRARLVDLGLARLVGERSLTRTGAVLGTPAWLAPEQALGLGTDERTDVFGLGALLFACLAGRGPREGGSLLAVLELAIREAPPPVRSLRPEVPRPLEAVVARATALDPAARFPSARAFLGALEGAQRGEMPAAAPRRGWRGAGAALVLLLLVAAAGALAWPRVESGAAVPVPAPWAREGGVREALRELASTPGPARLRELAALLRAEGAAAPPERRAALADQVAAVTSAAQGGLLASLVERGAAWARAEADAAATLAALGSAAGAWERGAALRAAADAWLAGNAPRCAQALREGAASGDERAIAAGRGLRAALTGAGPAGREVVRAALAQELPGLAPRGEEARIVVALRFEAVRRHLLGLPDERAVKAWELGRPAGVLSDLLALREGGDDLVAAASLEDRQALGRWREACPASRVIAYLALRRSIASEEAAQQAARVAAAAPGSDDDVGGLSDTPPRRLACDARVCCAGLRRLLEADPAEVERLGRAWLEERVGVPLASRQLVVEQLGWAIRARELRTEVVPGEDSIALWQEQLQGWRQADPAVLEVAAEGQAIQAGRRHLLTAECLRFLGEGLHRARRQAEARARLDEAWAEVQGAPSDESRGERVRIRVVRALVALAQGDLPAARADLQEAERGHQDAGGLYFHACLRLAAAEGGEGRMEERYAVLARAFPDGHARLELDRALEINREELRAGRLPLGGER